MEEFKQVLNAYETLDRQLKDKNAEIYALREQKKIKELELVDFLKTPEFSTFQRIERPNGTVITISRPLTWFKSSSISKSDLWEKLDRYFQNPYGDKSARSCYDFIMNEVKQESRSNEYKIELK
jgi:hypothetical protein